MHTVVNGLTAGTRVSAGSDIDLLPYAVIRAGETGTVVGVAEGAIEGVEVLWDQHHEGLNYWANRALLVDPEIEALYPTVVETLRELQPSVDQCVLRDMTAPHTWLTRALLLSPVAVIIRWLVLGTVAVAEVRDWLL